MAVGFKELYQFSATDGYRPYAGLTEDSQGNLYGTAESGTSDDGRVFEILSDGGSYDRLVPLLIFSAGDGSYPTGGDPIGGVFIDSSGNLLGTTDEGGAYNQGTVYEITATATGYLAPTAPLFSFNGGDNDQDPYGPQAGLVADSAGNLFGTTYYGGGLDGDDDPYGTIYEVSYSNGRYATAPVTLATFTGAGSFQTDYTGGDGREPSAPLIVDAAGDLFGTASRGSTMPTPDGLPYDDGVVFELPHSGSGYGAVTVLASFTHDGGTTPGAAPMSGLTMDKAGDLFGTTSYGDADGSTSGLAADNGTVFEIPFIAGTYGPLVTIASFNYTDGSRPVGGVIVDAAGNVFGTTSGGGTQSHGTVFEVPHSTGGYGQIVTLVDFTGNGGAAPGSLPEGTLSADSAGDLFGTTYTGGGANGGGTVFELTDTGFQVACYCSGTMILTPKGQVPIEALAAGDVIVTASGEHRPVRWIGRRHLDITRHADPRAVWPVRVSAGAFAENVPARDLWMSPGHNVFVGGVLMPVRVLVNGATVMQVPLDEVTYWHVELDRHDVILAENLPAESYLDTGNRTAFANGGAFLDMHPDFEPRRAADTCAPVRKAGLEVESARASLLVRAGDLGHTTTAAHDLHVMADGSRIEPIPIGARRLAFVLPAGCEEAALVSRSFVPCHVGVSATDSRVLGVCIRRLQADGADLDLRSMVPAAGWHRPEEKPSHVQRWTNGAAHLPATSRLIVVDLGGEGRYWTEGQPNVAARRA